MKTSAHLAANIVQRARLLAALDPAVLWASGLNLVDLDYQIEDVATALARRGLVPNEGLFVPEEEPGDDGEDDDEAFVLAGTPEDPMEFAGRILAQALAIKYPDAEHLVRLHLDGTTVWNLRLPDEYTLMLDADGRRYLGVRLPGGDDGAPTGLAVTTWDGHPDENDTYHPRGNKIDGEGLEYFDDGSEPLYRKCISCHLFVEEQDADEVALGHARYVHNHRGDDADEALDESHIAWPEPGPGAPLTWWKLYGPAAMRSRFINDETVDVLGNFLPRGRCDECGAPCDALTGKCMREPERHTTAQP